MCSGCSRAFRAPPLEKSFTNQPGWTNRAGRWPQLQEGLPFLFCPAHRFAEARGIGSLEALPLLLNQGWRRLNDGLLGLAQALSWASAARGGQAGVFLNT